MALCLIALTIGCSTEASDEQDRATVDAGGVVESDAGGDSAVGTSAPACPEQKHELLEPAMLGELVAWEPIPDLQLPATTIDSLLELPVLEAGHLAPTPHDVVAYRIRYTTQDRGERIEATAMVVLPDVEAPQTFPTVLRLHPFAGMYDECAPSRGALERALLAGVVSASRGFAVIAPDYLGLASFGEPSGVLHPLGVPEPAAVVSLDALRAGQRFLREALASDTMATGTETVGLWGMSQGGFHVLWALRYLADYAPELDVRGAVAAVPVGLAGPGPNLLDDVESPLMLLVAAQLIASHEWYEGSAPLTEVFTDEAPYHAASTLADNLGTQCQPLTLEGLSAPSDIYRAEFLQAVQEDSIPVPWSCYLGGNRVADTQLPPSDVPLLVVAAEQDEVLPVIEQRAGVADLCDQGRELEYLECAGTNHVHGTTASFARQASWLRDRIAGEPMADDSSCVIAGPVDCTTL